MSSPSKPGWLTEGVLLAVAPVLAYILAYLGAAGAAQRFGIPWSFVTPTASNVAEWLIGLVLILGPLSFALFAQASYEWDKLRDFFSYRYLRRLTAWLAFALVIYACHPPWPVFTGVALVAPAIVLSNDLRHLVTVIIQCVRWRQINSFTLNPVHPSVLPGPGFDGYTPVVCLAFLSVVSYFIGYYGTARLEWYWVPAQHTNEAVILTYRDQFVTVEFDPATGVVKRNFKVMKSEGEQLQWKKTGRLKPQTYR
jgi:hypothetical protein